MRTLTVVVSVFCVAISLSAGARSNDRIPLIEGEKETFGMVDLSEGQCSMAIEDTENGFVPTVEFGSLPVRVGGNFLGGVYLSSSTRDEQDKHAFAFVKIFKGDEGRSIISVVAELTYDGLAGGLYSVKNHQFFILLDRNGQPVDFKEQLAYKFIDSKTYASVNVPGKSRYDFELKSAVQKVSVANGTVYFVRTSATGVKFGVSCKIK